MKNFLGGIAIGAGIVIGIVVVALLGGVCYEVLQYQQVNDPINIEAATTQRYDELISRITKARYDDSVHYCFNPRDVAVGELQKTVVSNPNFEADLNQLLHIYGGECIAKYGWDNFQAPDSAQQYKRVMRAKIREAWFGDKIWLERKFSKADKRNGVY
jgi:hypothetical protein